MWKAKQLNLLGLFILLLIAPGAAHANGFASVGNVDVRKDVLTMSARMAYGADDDSDNQANRLRTRLMSDYGFTDTFASGLYLQGERTAGQNLELYSVIWDNRFEFTSHQEDGYMSGVRLRYTWRDGDKKPDAARIQFVGGKRIDKWELRGSQIVFHEVGPSSRSGIGLDSRYHVTYAYTPSHRAGLEGFSNFGVLREMNGFARQVHVFGPVLTGLVTDDISYEFGYGFGVSKAAPDHSWKFFISRRF